MQATQPIFSVMPSAQAGSATSGNTHAQTSALAHYQIIRRNGSVVPFQPNKIAVAMMKAFLAVHGTQGAASASVRETVDDLTQGVIRALVRSRPSGGTFHIEDVQDQVELGLMRGGHHEIARAYVLYREKRSQERARRLQAQAADVPLLHVMDGGNKVALDLRNLQALIEAAAQASSPRTWGCFPSSAPLGRYSSVFPTHVGVFLRANPSASQ